jgi:hypothetical protein
VFVSATSKAASNIFCHGTSLESAFSILRDRRINGTDGICGVGVYGFEVSDASDQAEAVFAPLFPFSLPVCLCVHLVCDWASR